MGDCSRFVHKDKNSLGEVTQVASQHFRVYGENLKVGEALDMAAMHHSIINSRVWIKTQTLSDLTDGCVHTASTSKTGSGVLVDRGTTNP